AAAQGFIGFETVAVGKSFGRPLKLDRQTIVAVVAALREWLETDHEQRIAGYQRRLEKMASELDGAHGVNVKIVRSEGHSPRVLRLEIDASQARQDVAGLMHALW